MKKSQLILIGSGIALVAILFTLPRVVVDNKEDKNELTESGDSGNSVAADMHVNEMNISDKQILLQLRQELDKEINREKFIIFTDSISSIYLRNGKFDSAAYYLEVKATKYYEQPFIEKAGLAYYEAFTFSLNEQKQAVLAEKTRAYLNEVLEKDPKRLDLKTKIAMTYVSSSNPMQGITMLREILEQDPMQEDALYQMGVLSMQSGQYKKAVERFEELVKHYPENLQGQFYLGVSYFESKQNNKAKKQFQEIKSMTQDQMILASVESYLERL
jgi:tetratricopeptide (TPR) repeat protein